MFSDYLLNTIGLTCFQVAFSKMLAVSSNNTLLKTNQSVYRYFNIFILHLWLNAQNMILKIKQLSK